VAAAGAPPHAKDALPAKPVPGVNCRVKTAVCPAVTVTEFEPGAAGEIVSAAMTEALRLMVCGELGASSVIAMIALRAPVANGASDTPIVHVVPTGYAAAAQWLLKLKSPAFVPPRATPLMCNVPVPALVSIMICGAAFVPWVTVPKERLLGVNFTTGVPGGGAAAVPVICTDCGEFGASSLMRSVAVRWPTPTGENVTAMLHPAPLGYVPAHRLLT